jgi:hypothetical protein
MDAKAVLRPLREVDVSRVGVRIIGQDFQCSDGWVLAASVVVYFHCFSFL